MNKRITTFLLTERVCLLGTNVWALDQKDGVYQIGNGEDLVPFSELVNGSENSTNSSFSTLLTGKAFFISIQSVALLKIVQNLIQNSSNLILLICFSTNSSLL